MSTDGAAGARRVVVFGAGATGARIVRRLGSSESVGSIEVRDVAAGRLRALEPSMPAVAVIGRGTAVPAGTDLVVVATPSGTQASLAAKALDAGAAVVTTSNDIVETRDLLELDAKARSKDLAVVVGAGQMPGLSCLLARYGAQEFDIVDEIHVAKASTGGPACARQHHRALSSLAIDWRDGRWQRRPGGSGRELCWFPDPVAGRDCYRAALPDALLLAPAFSGVDRVTARVSATRRDRLTAPLPMLRRPHPDGGVGAVRVELRGRRNGERHVVVLGSVARPSEATAVVATCAALARLGGAVANGSQGLAAMTDAAPMLHAVKALGVPLFRFEGFALSGDAAAPQEKHSSSSS